MVPDYYDLDGEPSLVKKLEKIANKRLGKPVNRITTAFHGNF